MQGVGYPDPNRSHFRSMEIWQTGTVGPAPPAGGWLGRLGDAHPRLELCHVGQGSMPLAVQGRKVVAQSLASVAAYRLGSGAELPSRFKEESGEPPLAEIRQRYTSSVELARRLEILRGRKLRQAMPRRSRAGWRRSGGSSRPTRRTGSSTRPRMVSILMPASSMPISSSCRRWGKPWPGSSTV